MDIHFGQKKNNWRLHKKMNASRLKTMKNNGKTHRAITLKIQWNLPKVDIL